MAITQVGTPLVTEVASDTSITITYPATTADNFLFLSITNSTSTAPATTPAGWTFVFSQNNATVPSISVYYKIATGSESGTFTVTPVAGTAGRLTGIISQWDGVSTSIPIDVTTVSNSSGVSLTFVEPSITTITDGALVLHTIAINGSSGTSVFDGPAEVTKIADTTGTGRRTSLFYEFKTPSGATGTRTFTVPGSTTLQWTGITVALRPFVEGGSVATPVLTRCVNDIPTTTTMAMAVNTTDAASVRIKAGTNSAVTTGVVFGSAVVPDGQGNSQLAISGLTPNTSYYYRIAMTDGNATEILDNWTVGQFKTDLNGQLNFSFAFGSCTNGTDSAALAAVAVKKPDIFFHLGDEYYADGSGTSLANFRSKMIAKKTVTNHKAVYRTSGSSMVPSDHDGMNNNSNYGTDSTAWTNWNTAYREINPDLDLPATRGIYRSFKRGRIRFIRIDRRSFATASSATDNSSKTCLGATQKQWFKDQITNATEPVIIVQNSDPWIISADTGDDGWGGYITERDELAAFITASGKNVAMLAGDMHALAAEDGSGSPGGVAVFQAAPLNNAASIKGGPYDVGPYPSSGTATVEQYGWIDVVDTGSQISLQYKGFSADNTQRITLTKNYTVSASSATLASSATGTLSTTRTLTASRSAALSGSGTLAAKPTGLAFLAHNWSAARLRTNGGLDSARILAIGDSTTLGFGTGGVADSYPYKVRDLFGSLAETGMVIPSNTASVVDSRWNVGTGQNANGDWGISGSFGWGNKSSYRATSTTVNDLVFTPGYTFDTVDFYYITSPTNATAPVHVGGALVGSLVSGSGKAAGWEKATISVPAGSTSVTLKPPGGNFWITGIHARTADRSIISVSSAGSSSSWTTDWISGSYDSRKGIAVFEPDLTIISLGINDSGNSVTAATYKSNMQAIITQAQVTGDVIVVTVPPSSESGSRVSLQQQYRTAVYELAATMNFSIVDINGIWNTFAESNAMGWMVDNVHPNNAGYDVIAEAVYETISDITVVTGASVGFTSTGSLSAAGSALSSVPSSLGLYVVRGGQLRQVMGINVVEEVVPPIIGNWRLAFEELFTGPTLSNKWATSWFNGSSMNNVTTSAANVSIVDDTLKLKLSSTSVGALINTNPTDNTPNGGFSFTTGYAEARIWFSGPDSTHIYNWPAWWTNGQPTWPENGEHDIAEPAGWSGANNMMTTNYHWKNPTTELHNSIGSGTVPGNWANSWHKYAVHRKVGSADYYFDDVKIFTVTTYDAEAPHFLILNMGGTPQTAYQMVGDAGAMLVDYVRVWVPNT